MQDEFNYYKFLVRQYLLDYKTMEAAIAAWARERADLESDLATVPVAVSRYGDEPGGGTGELNVVERQAQMRLQDRERLAEIEQDTKDLSRIMTRVKNAVDSLEAESQTIVWRHYVHGDSWYDIAAAMHYSTTAVKQRGYRAIGCLALIIFGNKAHVHERVALIV